MPIEIASIQLNRIHHLATLEQAQWVAHTVPGREGTVTQDLGRASVRLDIRGICYGDRAQDDLERLRQVYKKREAVDFLAEIVGQAYFSRVIVEQFEVLQRAAAPDEYGYRLIVAEFVPPQAKATGARVNQSINAKAAGFMTASLLPDALQMGALPEISNPIEPLRTSLAPVQDATQGIKTVTTQLQALLGL
ncbi:DNA circularization N-terminal domain-containing protein [Nodosilinea sp. LEGE 06152]|uniref:DNA circularization N-terminal domain-containing protein n=1 Tax=Nodosilinea sp. LEGE 06152 TaxID=2777966 RepID=UPI0018827334|nr:DNA circularization N-terminal domain-containing protein [Nodosilinea sp. LEGE 06152]MBE9158165.1 DNA circularization N-terminal domain-containing protein [Nodosilinea sp. LEGE 06152]